jgi:macrodomain Ter protein organizer (MatP/YcbG family)
MGTITVSIDDDAEKELRDLVEKEGRKKGDLGKVISEAIKKMIEEKRQKEIAERQLKRMSEGMYTLPKGWKFNRDEIYDRY